MGVIQSCGDDSMGMVVRRCDGSMGTVMEGW